MTVPIGFKNQLVRPYTTNSRKHKTVRPIANQSHYRHLRTGNSPRLNRNSMIIHHHHLTLGIPEAVRPILAPFVQIEAYL